MSFIPTRQLDVFEMRVQQAMGKGWGAQSVTVEPISALELLSKHYPKITNPVLFDVGANVGNWTEGALVQNHMKVICFEPSSKSYETLVAKFASDARVRVENLALGASNHSARLFSDSPGSSLSSLTKRNLDHLGIEFNSTEVVEVVTLDTWVRCNQIFPDILKLDVEGYEMHALLGSTDILTKIKVIQLEFGGCNIDTKTFFADYWNLLKKLQFNFYRLTPRGLKEISKYSENLETFTTTNYFAVKANSK